MTAYLFTVSDPLGQEVQLTESCYRQSKATEAGRNQTMAAITIPDSVKRYFPRHIDQAHLWVHYNPKADALTVYFTDEPVPSVWEDIDKYVYIGFASEDETRVTGVMIEHFSQWLLAGDLPETL